MNISYLPDPTSHQAWGGIRALLERGARLSGSKAFIPGECVWIMHEDGKVWAAVSSAITEDGEAEIRNCGGTRLSHWLSACEATLCEWARNCGARKVTLRGRPGWRRFADSHGWKFTETIDGFPVFEKELT